MDLHACMHSHVPIDVPDIVSRFAMSHLNFLFSVFLSIMGVVNKNGRGSMQNYLCA